MGAVLTMLTGNLVLNMSDASKSAVAAFIGITCPCDLYPLTPNFYIVKLGVYRGIHNFLIFALKHRLWVLVRTAPLRRLEPSH